ncbi:MAG: hypothetical protein LIO46_03775 [Clostridiales bacterium]|nr:hypothetical protein [Clostridiales bacterium]
MLLEVSGSTLFVLFKVKREQHAGPASARMPSIVQSRDRMQRTDFKGERVQDESQRNSTLGMRQQR